MSDGFFDVRVRTTRYSAKFQTEAGFAKGWQSVLGNAYQRTHAMCLCPGRGERKLSIKHREPGGYHLARFRDSGHEHAVACRFYGPSHEYCGLQGYAPGAIEELDDGTWRVRLGRGLRARSPTAADNVSGAHTAHAGVVYDQRQPTVTLLGFLHHLWSTARLEHWYPAMEGERNSDRVHYWLRSVAEKTRISRMTLADVLLVQATRGSTTSDRNEAVVAQAIKHRHHLVLVPELPDFVPEWHTEAPKTLPIKGPAGMPHLNMAPEMWTQLLRAYVRQWAAWSRGERVMVIAQASVRQGKVKPQATVLDAALMHVSPRWIPLDSRYEGLLEQRLHDQRRIFRKPLRFDATEDVVFPDFVLLDTDRPCPMEVFGMKTSEYLARRQVKAAYYDRTFGTTNWWYWDAANDPEGLRIPALPRATPARNQD